MPDDLSGYLPETADVTWLEPPAAGQSALAQVVEGIDWPAGEGYFWMAGESAQMRAIRKHLMREVGLPDQPLRRHGLLARDGGPPAARRRSRPHLARGQGGREE